MTDAAGRREAVASKREKSGNLGCNRSELDPNYPDN
jgi:hypothetical protein